MISPFARGERIRVLQDKGSNLLVGLEGVVDSVNTAGVAVILENDPASNFHVNMTDRPGIIKDRVVRRFFYFGEIEKI